MTSRFSCFAALLVELEQALEDHVVGEAIAPIGPAVGGGDGLVQVAMGMVEPGRALVVEIGERALFQDRGGLVVDGQDAVGIAGHDFGHALHEIGGIEPGLAQVVEALRGSGDGDRARVGGVVGGRDVRRQAFGEGEGFEGRRGCVAWIIADTEPSAEPQRPNSCIRE